MYPQNYGVLRQGVGKAVLEPIPIPKVKDDYILVRTTAVAQNPTDHQTLDAEKGDFGTLVGCDYTGVVEEVGKAVTKTLKKGDRVAGIGHGANDMNPESGAFARYVSVKGDLQMLVPDSVSDQAASTVGAGIATAGAALYQHLGLPLPGDAKSGGQTGTILIYGGSTATGTLAIQFAKLSGWKVITTCSPKNFDLVKSRGADEVYDYRNPNIGQELRKATKDTLTKVLDCINTEATAAICAEAISSSGGEYCELMGLESPRKDVKSSSFLGYSMSGEEYIYEADTYPAEPEFFEFAKKFYALAERLWAEGKWKAHPQRVLPGGLNGIIDQGLQEGRDGKISGEKLVYIVDQTKWP